MAKRTGEYHAGDVFSMRLNAETADELRWAVKESGRSASDLIRRGLGPILAVIRADWYEKHGSGDDWEEVKVVQVGTPRKLKSSFGVGLTYEEVVAIGHAARACGVSISAYLREAGLAIATAQREGGTARCAHLSLSPVTSAECHVCGPLPVTYAVTPS